MDKDQFQGMLALKLVAEKKSFSLAAQELRISPPAISKIITQLEKKMKVTLLTRTTRAVNLTEAGIRFLEIAGPAMDQIILAQESAKSLAQKPSGILKINMPGAIYSHLLSQLFTEFIKKHPQISLDIYSEDKTTNIIANNFDAGIRSYDLLEKDMIAIKLTGQITWAIAASPNYLNKYGRPKHPKDLLKHNCLISRFGMGDVLYDRWEFQDKNKEFEVKVQGNLITNDFTVLHQMALDGLGLMYTSEEIVAKEIKNKKLEIVLNNFKTYTEGFYLYFPKSSQNSPKLRAFIDFVHEFKKTK